MNKGSPIIIANLDEKAELSLDEICELCSITPNFIEEVVAYGIIEPQNNYRFSLSHLSRVRTIIHLQRDLEVNLPGAALVIELMEELSQLRTKVKILEK